MSELVTDAEVLQEILHRPTGGRHRNADRSTQWAVQAWGDPESGMVWCVSEAPSAEAVKRIHERAGHPATEVYPVPVEV